MKRFALLVTGALLVALTSLAAAPSALANNDPHRVFLPAGPVDLPVGFCSFPVHIDVVANKEYGKITTLPDGTTIIKETGTLKDGVTNVSTGKTLLFNASGPGTITIYPNGSVTVDGTGHWLIYLPAASTGLFGFPGMMLTSGQIHATLDPTGTPTALSVTGRMSDVCGALG
jgi:hypothetical protein